MESNSPFAPPTNTYQNPQSWQAGPNAGAVPVQTTGLTIIFVLFLIFGFLGMLSGAGTVLALVFEDMFKSMNKADNVLMQKMQEAQAPFRIPGLIFAGVNVMLSVLLLVGALGLMSRKQWGLNISRLSCKIGLLVEVLRVGLGITQQVFTMSSFMQVSPEDMGRDVPPDAFQVMVVSMSVGMIIGIVMMIIYAIGKMVVYYLSNRHLSKPEIAGLFS
ncbi:MAG: hypothetical protein J0M26_20575 [Planctomycetes bacterium]|nr:hypothetical protein [Planctomycetota bacterium]